MCGIAGVFGDPEGGRIRRMTDALHHRGPDQGGFHDHGELHLGIRRLAIIDIEGGSQPIAEPARGRAIVMNGEIYNYRELRRELAAKGHTFRTGSDTEVVLRAYEEYGEDCPLHLRGMFAFAIADGGRIFVARDRLGIKPLFYCHLERQGLFLFASEIKALLAVGDVPAALSLPALGDTLLMRHPFGPDTCFEGIANLAPGSTLSIGRGDAGLEITERRYYRATVDPAEDGDFEAAVRAVREKLEETVEAHLAADVEVGVLLSGGIDSSLLAAMMSRHLGSRLRAFTTAPAADFPDLAIARQVAAGLAARHHVQLTSWEDFTAAIPDYLLAVEGPGRLAGMSAFLLCREVGRQMKVCLVGEGSDEIFGGYSTFLGPNPELDGLPRTLERIKAAGLGPSRHLRRRVEPLIASRKQGPSASLEAHFQFHLEERLEHPHLLFFDRIGMAASLELRVPFVDHQLVELAAGLPLRFKVDLGLQIQKYVLKRVALDGFGPLLAAAALRSKVGFPSTDQPQQLRFRQLCRERLGEHYRATHELGPAFADNADLLLFELFHLLWIEGRGRLPAGFSLEDFVAERASRAAARREKTTFALCV